MAEVAHNTFGGGHFCWWKWQHLNPLLGIFFVCLVNELCPSTTNELDHTKHLALMGCPDHPTNGQSNENYKQEFCCCPLSAHNLFLGGEMKSK